MIVVNVIVLPMKNGFILWKGLFIANICSCSLACKIKKTSLRSSHVELPSCREADIMGWPHCFIHYFFKKLLVSFYMLSIKIFFNEIVLKLAKFMRHWVCFTLLSRGSQCRFCEYTFPNCFFCICQIAEHLPRTGIFINKGCYYL